MPNVVFQQIAQPGPGYAATSTTSLAIGTGSKVFATQAGLAYSAGARVRAASASGPTNYMEGTVTAYSGTSLTINVDIVGGSGTKTDWNINLTGNPGGTGPTGPGYLATSTTSLTPATGSKTFTTQAGLAYLAGLRVRAVSASDATVWMEGPVSSYSGTSLVLTVDLIGTATTKADWNIGAAGTQGAAGTNGTNASAANWRGVYASGTTYAQGDGASYSGSDYVSLAGSNTGQQPDISPTWWQNIGTSGLGDPGADGLVKRVAPNTTAVAVPGTDYAAASHHAQHQNGGSDEIATATPGANAIPKAGSGGTLAIGWLASGTPDGTKFVRDDGTLVAPSGGGQVLSLVYGVTNTTVWSIAPGQIGNPATSNGPMVMPRACTLSKLYVSTTNAVSGVTFTVTVYKNGSATSLTVSMTSGTLGSDTTHSVSFAAGDTMIFNISETGSQAITYGISVLLT